MDQQQLDRIAADQWRAWTEFFARTDIELEPEYWEGRIVPAENKVVTLMQQWILDQAKPVWQQLLDEGTAVHNRRRFTLDMSVAAETSGGNLSGERA
jgi:hypothetical protein